MRRLSLMVAKPLKQMLHAISPELSDRKESRHRNLVNENEQNHQNKVRTREYIGHDRVTERTIVLI